MFLIQAPTFTIASNAGYDGALVIGKLLEQNDHNLGFDASKGLLQEINQFMYCKFPFILSLLTYS